MERGEGIRKGTTIAVSRSTLEELKSLKVHPREALNDVLARLVQEHVKREGRSGIPISGEKHGIAKVCGKIVPDGRSRRPGERRDGDPPVDDDRRLDEAEPQARLAEVPA